MPTTPAGRATRGGGGVKSFIALINNAALLLAMVFVYDLVTARRRTTRTWVHQIIVGLVLGAIGTAVMLTHLDLRVGSGLRHAFGPVRAGGGGRGVEDITERKQAEEALRESGERLQALIQTAPIAIIQVDREEMVKLWNPAAERVFGWRKEEVLDRPLPFIPADRCAEAEAMHQESCVVSLNEVLEDVTPFLARTLGEEVDLQFHLDPTLGLHRHLPVLFMSGYSKDAIVHDGRLDPGVSFIEKPFNAEGLLRRVQEVLDA